MLLHSISFLLNDDCKRQLKKYWPRALTVSLENSAPLTAAFLDVYPISTVAARTQVLFLLRFLGKLLHDFHHRAAPVGDKRLDEEADKKYGADVNTALPHVPALTTTTP